MGEQQPPQQPPERRVYDEKQRDMDEKELEKRDEKEEKEEKSFDEKRRRDPVGALVWAATLIWGGVVLLGQNLDFFNRVVIRLGDSNYNFPFELERWVGAWQVFWLGTAALVVLGVIARVIVPGWRGPILGSLIWAIVLVGIALGEWTYIWPLILIAIGVSLLFGGVLRRRR